MAILRPADTAELAEAIASAAARGDTLELRGGGSKAAIGTVGRRSAILDMRGFAGVVDYDPAELVLTVRPGTRLAEVEALIAGAGQMLAFEPFDHGPLFGAAAGQATIGGVVAAGIAGSRRLAGGGVRDHLLGFAAVSGRGEPFVAGGKVVKNVTGYDLPKLIAGSWGRLAALTELTLKVLPAPRETATCAIAGLAPDAAGAAMAQALGSQADPSAAAYLPDALTGGPSLTLFRLQGFGPSVVARCRLLADLLPGIHARDDGEALWRTVRDLAPLEQDLPLWRISIAAARWPALVAAFPETRWLADWGGGLVWMATDRAAADVRAAAEVALGHAMLVRGDQAPAFHPRPAGVAALEARVRRAFDPAGVFETGRFEDAADAD